MLPEIGSLIFVNGNEAAIVIGYGVGADGADDGSVIVGTFAGAQQFEQGHFGSSPGVAGENPPSYVPESQQVAVATAGPVLPTAGGTAVSEVAGDAPASVVQTSEQAASGDATIELSGPAVPGSTSVDFESANGVDREQTQDERIAALEAELAAARAVAGGTGTDVDLTQPPAQTTFGEAAAGEAQPTTTTSDAAQPPAGTTPPDAGSHSGL
jgi:hypothetical protein